MDFSITGTLPSCPLVNVDDDPSSSVQGKYLLHTSVGKYSRIEEIIHQFLFLLKRFDDFESCLLGAHTIDSSLMVSMDKTVT